VEGSISAAKNMEASSYETYHENTEYSLYIIMQYKVPKNGYLKIKLPEDVFIETKPNIKISKGTSASASGLSIQLVNDPVADVRTILIKLNEEMDRGSSGSQVYTIFWDGNRNPRTFLPTGLISVEAYDGVISAGYD